MLNVIKCEFDIKRKYEDFRDWFILNDKVHETNLQIFICGQLIGESMFPINAKGISCEIEASVQKDCDLQYLEWCVPEMDIRRKKNFNAGQYVNVGDTVTAEVEINMFGEE
jgi:hypothetical protein